VPGLNPVGLVLACSSPARTSHDPAILIASRIVNRGPNPGGIVNQLAVQRQSRPLLPELSELFSGFHGFPAIAGLASLRSFFDGNLLRVEDEMKDGLYEVRAELPGVDPTDDIEVTVRDGQLTIKAERTQTSESNGHSEFSYGSFARTVPLPAGADEDDINAVYDRGILTVSVPLSEDHPTEKRVEVIETILADEDEDDDEEDDDADVQEEHVAEEQQQPAG
jgi:HSP20 family molecular chaperone IbpA